MFYSALKLATLVALGLGGLMLVFSWRDSISQWRQVFDVRLAFRAFRSIALHIAFRPVRFSLGQLLAAVSVVAVATPLVVVEVREHGIGSLFEQWWWLVYLAVIVLPLVVIFASDAFGPSPRERWKRFTKGSENTRITIVKLDTLNDSPTRSKPSH